MEESFFIPNSSFLISGKEFYMDKRLVFSSVAAVIIAVLFLACDPLEGSIDEVKVKAGGGGPTETTYTVTFDTAGGSSVPEKSVKEGAVIDPPPNPTKESNNFVNWFADPEYTEFYRFSTPVTRNITLYGKWTTETATYIVSFITSGGSSVAQQTIYRNEKVYPPDDPVKRGNNFGGWCADNPPTTLFNFSTAVITMTRDLYAKWDFIDQPPGATLAEKFAWLQSNVTEDSTYILQAFEDETLTPQILRYPEYDNVTIKLVGIYPECIISKPDNVNGSLLTVGGTILLGQEKKVTLILDNYITLKGHNNNAYSLVNVVAKSELIMENGSTITGNTKTGGTGGAGVFVSANAKFTMKGGTISGNTVIGDDSPLLGGGGVSIGYNGVIDKTGGTIYGNDTGNSNANKVVNSSGIPYTDKGSAVRFMRNQTGTIISLRESTAGPSVLLDSTKTGAAGGWE